MSYQSINSASIPSLQGKKLVNFQQSANMSQYPNATPMQGNVDAEAIKQSVDNSYVANRVKASQENDPVATAGLAAASWYGISQGMEKFNKMQNVGFENCTFGKMGQALDKFSEKTWVGKAFQKSVDGIKSGIDKLAQKSKTVNCLKTFSTSPEWSLVKNSWRGLLGYHTADTSGLLEEFLKPITENEPKTFFKIKIKNPTNNFQKMGQYGWDQARINAFKDSVKHLSFEEQAAKLVTEEIKALGGAVPSSAKKLDDLLKIAKDLKLGILGVSSHKEFKKLSKTFLDNPDELTKMLKNLQQNGKVKTISVWKDCTSLWGKIKSHFIGREVGVNELYNKNLVARGKAGVSTLGKNIPKMFGWILEGGTNRFAGGKLAVAMQAGIMADILYNTIKAPKNEKIKTFAERCVNDFMYFVGLTVGVLGIHKLGGLKFIGLKTTADKEKYLQKLAELNEKIDLKQVSKSRYKAIKKILRNKYLGYKKLNFFQKGLQKLGSFINSGNQRLHSYQSTSKMNINWLRKLGNSNLIGVPLRFWLAMSVVTPFLVKHTVGLVHKVLGRPTRSVLDEEEETNEKQSQPVPQSNQAFQGGQNPQTIQPTQPKNPQDYDSDSNLIKMHANGETPNVRTYIPSPECMVKPDKNNQFTEQEPVRTYIPSPEGVVVNGPDMSAANMAMAGADKAEDYINQTLATLTK